MIEMNVVCRFEMKVIEFTFESVFHYRVYLALGASSSRWCNRANPPNFGTKIQLR